MTADIEGALAVSGLKKTKHRIMILEALEQSKQPLHAEQVYILLKDRGVDINLSTIYRALDALCDKQLATKLQLTSESGSALYEYNRMVHRHYLVCVYCKKIVPIDGCPLHDYEHELEAKTGFKLLGHKLEMYGCCPECAKKGLSV